MNKKANKNLKANVIEILQELQEKEGYLPQKDMINLSNKLNIPGVDISGVATFYSQFKFQKPGKYLINICNGTACHVKGSLSILGYLESFLGIKCGQTTADGKITLQSVNCIGACAKAPAMMINTIVYGELDKKKIKKIIDDLQ